MIRILLSLAASLFLTGCPSENRSPAPTPPQPTPAPAPASTPETAAPETPAEAEPSAPEATSETPSATPQAAASAKPVAYSAAASATPEPTPNEISYEGTWTAADAQGQAFDIVLFPNGQVVTNWTKGADGARGERGYWRKYEGRLTIVYSDGSTDIIEPDEGGFRYRRYSAGSPLDSEPVARGEVKRVDESQSTLIGVWRLNKEPDGSHLYIALQSNGRAVSTINGGTEGKWKTNQRGALCEWPDGWIDQIERGAAGWQKRSWIGSESSAPADLSLATRVGEKRFSVEP